MKGDLDFAAAEMRRWWHGFQPIDELDEEIIEEDETLESTLSRVLDDCWGSGGPGLRSPGSVSPGAAQESADPF